MEWSHRSVLQQRSLMTIPERTSIASHIAAVVLCGTVAVCAVGAFVTYERLADAALPVVKGAAQAMDHVNKPCQGSGKDKADNCGTLALAGQVMEKSGDAVVTTQLQEQSTVKGFVVLLGALTGTSHQLAKTADAATGTLNAASDTLKTTGQSVQRVAEAAIPVESNTAALVGHLDVETAPLVTHADLVIQQVDGLAANPAIPTILTNFAGITGSTNDLLARGYLVEKKATQCYLYPTMRCRIDSLIVPTFQVAGPLIQAFK
jgi:hypothetical protein